MKIRYILAASLIASALAAVPAGASELSAEQVEELGALNIMCGDENGNLRLSDTITRAEAARMLCEAGKISTSWHSGEFSDVPPEHWAFNYICAIKDRGIAVGDENGSFKPESKITNEEAVKMIVCLLGYDSVAEHTGGFPAGYTSVAAQIGITRDMQLVPGQYATRNDVGNMISNALGVPLLEKRSTEQGDEFYQADGENGIPLKTLRIINNSSYDSSRNKISEAAHTFAKRYEYREGDSEKSFELYPGITYTSGIEKDADGREYECPAVYDDEMAKALLDGMKKSSAKLSVNGRAEGKISYAVYNGRLLVPADILKYSGCDVSFDSETYVLTVSRDGTVLEILPNLIGMRKNRAEGFWVPLEVCARFIGGEVYVPPEAVAREFGIDIVFDGDKEAISIG